MSVNPSGGAGDDGERPSPEPVDPWAPPTGAGDPVPPSPPAPAYPAYPASSWPAYSAPPGPAYPPPPGWAAGAPPGYGPAYATPPGYGTNVTAPGVPIGFYAGPDDPLVSPNFSEWWQRSFRLLATTWRPILLVELWWAVPMLVLGVVGSGIESDTVVDTSTGATLGDVLGAVAVFLPMAFLGLLLTAVVQLAALHVVVQRATGQQVSVRAALVAALRRFHAITGWGLAAIFLVGGGFVLCVLPGVYVAFALVPLPAVVLLERGKGIGRAFELFHHRFGDSLARAATIAGLILGVGVLNSVVARLVGTESALGRPIAEPGLASLILGGILSSILSIVMTVLVTPLLLTAYADMRARREPFSTAYLMPAPTEPPVP